MIFISFSKDRKLAPLYCVIILKKLISVLGLLNIARKITLATIAKIQNQYYINKLLPLVKRIPAYNRTVNKLKSIMHINLYDTLGGAALLAYNLSTQLNILGFDSRLMVSIKYSQDKKVKTIPPNRSFRYAILNQNIWPQMGSRKWDDFFRISNFKIRKNKYFKKTDIVHLHNLHGGYFSPFFLPLLTSLKPTIWTLHDVLELYAPCGKLVECNFSHVSCTGCSHFDGLTPNENNLFIWNTKKKIYDNSAILKIICPSKWLKEKVGNSYLKNKSLQVIHNGININEFMPSDRTLARKSLGLPLNKTILLFIAHGGMSSDTKGGDSIDEIYCRLKSRYDIFCITIGGEKDLENDNRKEVSYIFDTRILALYYSAADLFVHPTREDVFGLVVAESISCGTPVVSYAVGGVPEIVDHMETGYLAEPGNLDHLIRGIEVFLNNPVLQNKTREIGYGIVERKFSLKIMTEQYIDVYNEVLGTGECHSHGLKAARSSPG